MYEAVLYYHGVCPERNALRGMSRLSFISDIVKVIHNYYFHISWELRLKIALEMARGLHYMQSGTAKYQSISDIA